MADLSGPMREAALERMTELEQLAISFYELADVQQAARYFGEASSIAGSLKEEAARVRLARWWGACLFECGRLREAFAALAPVVMLEPQEQLEEFYVAVVKYIEAAQMIPVSLASLEAAHARLGQFVSDTHLGHWRHMISRLRADLSCLRGDYHGGLAAAQLSWRLASSGPDVGPHFIDDEYLNTLVRSQLLSGDLESARETLVEWEFSADQIPSYRSAIFNSCRSVVSRRIGDSRTAVDAGRTALAAAEISNHYQAMCLASNALARALICSGELDLADDIIARQGNRLRDESLIEEFRTNVLRGDLELARIRLMAGLPIVDEETLPNEPEEKSTARAGSSAPTGSVPTGYEAAVTGCRDFYFDALEQGAKLDTLLECAIWSETARSRTKRLDAVAMLLPPRATRRFPPPGTGFAPPFANG
jgi:hypothetical protein